MVVLFKYCADVENCESFRDFGIYIYVWANFALGSNGVKGKARPNILYEGIRTSEDNQPRNE